MNPEEYGMGGVTLKDVLLFPLKVVGVIALWIVGVWIWLFFAAIGIGIPVAIGIAIYSAVFGGVGNDNEISSPSVDEYLEEVSPSLDRAAAAAEEWTEMAEEHARIDATSLTMGEALDLVEDELAMARKARETTSQALDEMRVVIPPDECLDVHLGFLEALQLTERGMMEITAYLSGAVRSGVADEEARERGNRLLAEADRVKASIGPSLKDCQ